MGPATSILVLWKQQDLLLHQKPRHQILCLQHPKKWEKQILVSKQFQSTQNKKQFVKTHSKDNVKQPKKVISTGAKKTKKGVNFNKSIVLVVVEI